MEQDNIINLEITSEDSDNESTEENEYMGYQPLSIHDLNEDSHDESRVNEMTVDRSERSISSNVLYNNQEFLNLDVWNTPRPEALSIEIDQSKVAQVGKPYKTYTNTRFLFMFDLSNNYFQIF